MLGWYGEHGRPKDVCSCLRDAPEEFLLRFGRLWRRIEGQFTSLCVADAKTPASRPVFLQELRVAYGLSTRIPASCRLPKTPLD